MIKKKNLEFNKNMFDKQEIKHMVYSVSITEVTTDYPWAVKVEYQNPTNIDTITQSNYFKNIDDAIQYANTILTNGYIIVYSTPATIKIDMPYMVNR